MKLKTDWSTAKDRPFSIEDAIVFSAGIRAYNVEEELRQTQAILGKLMQNLHERGVVTDAFILQLLPHFTRMEEEKQDMPRLSNKLPRGIRNHNPGNIKHNPANDWLGLAEPPSDGTFCRFVTPVYGIRVIYKLLVKYQVKHGCDTIRKLINRWAPPVRCTFCNGKGCHMCNQTGVENNTTAYAIAVAQEVGWGVDEPIRVQVMGGPAEVTEAVAVRLIAAIIRHENGMQPYTPNEIQKGILMGM